MIMIFIIFQPDLIQWGSVCPYAFAPGIFLKACTAMFMVFYGHHGGYLSTFFKKNQIFMSKFGQI